MKKLKKVDSKEVGLEMGLIIFKYFFKKEHLHYGYWTEDLTTELSHLPQAQDNYCHFLMSHIPANTKTILDVGSGVGRLAEKLINSGYQVDGILPSAVLTKHAREILGNKSHIFERKFEELDTENRYDLIIFAESFQYINMEKALQNSCKLLNPNGYILISDFFKTDASGESILGGGHHLVKFYEMITNYPFRKMKDIDLTAQTAPTLDVANDLLMQVGLPIWNLINDYLSSNYPYLSKFLHWKYQKKIAKINRIYFSGKLNSQNFAVFKTYRLMLFQKVKA